MSGWVRKTSLCAIAAVGAMVQSVAAAPGDDDDPPPSSTTAAPAPTGVPPLGPITPPPPRDPTGTGHSDASGNALPDDGASYYMHRASDDIIIRTTPPYSKKAVAAAATLAGIGVVVAGAGLHWNLNARDESNQVSAAQATNQPWTPQLQALYDQSQRDNTRAEVSYAIGGSLAVAGAILFIVTAPSQETTVIHPATAIVPTHGGAAMAASWRF